MPFHYRHQTGGELANRTLEAFTPSRFQNDVLGQPDTLHWYSALDSNQHLNGFKPFSSAIGIAELVRQKGVEPLKPAF